MQLKICLALTLMLASASAEAEKWASSGDGMKCVALRSADAAGLWIASDEPDERTTAVESSRDRRVKRAHGDAPQLFFEVKLRADRPIQKCMRLRWRVEPWGPNPVDIADFGGRFPSGTVDVIYDSHHAEAAGAIQVWVPDDHLREDPETFRIVVLDPIRRTPLAGTIGAYDPATGMRAKGRTRQSLDMANRMVMTVVDAPEQGAESSQR